MGDHMHEVIRADAKAYRAAAYASIDRGDADDAAASCQIHDPARFLVVDARNDILAGHSGPVQVDDVADVLFADVPFQIDLVAI